MERIDSLIAYKRQLFGWYAERLRAVPRVTLNAEPQGVKNSFWIVTAIPDARYTLGKFALQTALAEHANRALNGEIKRGADVVGFFPNDDAIVRLSARGSWNRTMSGPFSAPATRRGNRRADGR